MINPKIGNNEKMESQWSNQKKIERVVFKGSSIRPEVFCQKFPKIHRKMPVLKSLFNKI